MEDRIQITVNGEPRQEPAPVTLAELLRRIGLDTRKVAVERNLEIVPAPPMRRRSSPRATGWRSCISSAEA